MSSTFFVPPKQRTLHTEAYAAIRRAILLGGLKPGERVNEAEISRQMQISRAPIREAIRQLEQEGLLENAPRRGTFVAKLSRSGAEEVYTLRADLEARALSRAITRLQPEDLANLQSLTDAMILAGQNADVQGLLEADLEFHRILIRAAGWPRLERIWESLHPQTLTIYSLTTLTDWPLLEHAQRHTPLLQAIQTGDPAFAVQQIRAHILRAGEQVIQRLPEDRLEPAEGFTIDDAPVR